MATQKLTENESRYSSFEPPLAVSLSHAGVLTATPGQFDLFRDRKLLNVWVLVANAGKATSIPQTGDIALPDVVLTPCMHFFYVHPPHHSGVRLIRDSSEPFEQVFNFLHWNCSKVECRHFNS